MPVRVTKRDANVPAVRRLTFNELQDGQVYECVKDKTATNFVGFRGYAISGPRNKVVYFPFGYPGYHFVDEIYCKEWEVEFVHLPNHVVEVII